MSEFKVRAVDFGDQKSKVEIEEELIKKAEDGVADEVKIDASGIEPAPKSELTEEEVLSYIGKRYNKQINSFDELVSERKDSEELPEDVAAYLKFKKETGRGFDDFVKVNRDYDKVEPVDLIRDYLSQTQPELDEDDIEVLMEQYSYDEEIDDDDQVKKAKIAIKKATSEAKNYFNSQKEKYKVPLESSTGIVPKEEKEQYEAYREYMQKAKSEEESIERRRKWFEQKTEEVFGKDFKGFEFDIDGNKIVFNPGSVDELKKNHLNPSNFISKFLDNDGLLSDSFGYHKSLAAALSPEKLASFFFEQGKSFATDQNLKDIKNINMTERKAPQNVNKGGFQVKAVNPDSGRNLKIRSIK